MRMKKTLRYDVCKVVCVFALLAGLLAFPSCNGRIGGQPGSDSAKPWVFWYWMKASVSREGIKADLEAMKEAGIGGAYLMPIKGPDSLSLTLIDSPAIQLSDRWWNMVQYAAKEADRLGLKLGMHASDGFALAGGPWITPELSMQKVVWTETHLEGGKPYNDVLPQPETNEGYYEDIAVYAYPTPGYTSQPESAAIPKVTTSLPDTEAQFLADPTNTTSFHSDEPCWILYEFGKPFICRSVRIRAPGSNYQARRLILEASNDGKNFQFVTRLVPPRHGWQDNDADVTYAVRAVNARYYRFTFDKRESEPGAEDLDAAKWKPTLKITGIELSPEPRIHEYEGKNGSVWRISERSSSMVVPDYLCLKKDEMFDITRYVDAKGRINWNPPPGYWTILRMGHTSTGHTNYTGGGALGLECDKFNPEAVRLQFEKWFGAAYDRIGPELASRVLKVFHTDSWECGSQNWSPVFREEFIKRRGYDPIMYLPAMAGIPVESADVSERFLYDVRQTIAELVHDNFYGTLAELAHDKDCIFTAESVAPTMTSDGMWHYDLADVPMGEFWLNSPTHDKPNDMLDAVSGAHIYGKSIIQAEAFTTLRMNWDEHPSIMKAVGDRNYAMGANRFVYHVFVHNPSLNRKPGMTLDGVGLYFQRDQTWWKPGRAWVEYARRCQQLLQDGRPVVDIAVFTGEEVPRRSILPDRLVSTLPGIFGGDRVKSEAGRLSNKDEPLVELPEGVIHSANMADPVDWVDPLRGYAYDSFNKDALLRLARVRNGRIELPGGASYAILIVPAARPMSPDPGRMTPEVATQLLNLVRAGATVMLCTIPDKSPSLVRYPECDKRLNDIFSEIKSTSWDTLASGVVMKKMGKGKIVMGPYRADSFRDLGINRDFRVEEKQGVPVNGIAWTHRSTRDKEIYFISNQLPEQRELGISLRGDMREVELYDPVTNTTRKATTWHMDNGRINLPVRLEPNGSLFVILDGVTMIRDGSDGVNWNEFTPVKKVVNPWQVRFDPSRGGPEKPVPFFTLSDWSKHADDSIRYYSGTARYETYFDWDTAANKSIPVWIELGDVADIAEVYVNNVSCGIAWTPPYRLEITKALKPGINVLAIEVSNTWHNRLIGDHALPEEQRITNTTAPYRLTDKPLSPAGLLGPVTLCRKKQGK